MTSDFKVLIVGAGIAGPALAYWLTRAKANYHITLIEQSATPRLTGQAIDLHDLSVEVIKAMGLERQVRDRSTTETGTVVLDRAGKAVATFAVGEAFTAEYEILRADFAELLTNTKIKHPRVQHKFGIAVTAVEQDEKSVHVSFSGGSQGTFDLLVAADGAASSTRPLFLDASILQNHFQFLGQYIAFFSIPRIKSDTTLWYWFNLPRGRSAMLRPHRNDSTVGAYLCLTTPAHGQRDDAVEKALDAGTAACKQLLRERFSGAGWQSERILSGMDVAEDFYMSRCAQVKLPKWTSGRCVVLGDAAWATFGVGTSLAVEGAYYLAGELSDVKMSSDISTALGRYEKKFRVHYAKYEALPSAFPQIAFPQTEWALRLRDLVLWLVSKSKVYKLLQRGSRAKFELPNYDWRREGYTTS